MKKVYRLIIDTEGAQIRDNGGVSGANALAYDVGVAVIDLYGHVYETKSFVIKEVFYGRMDLMTKSYFKNKRQRYEMDMRTGLRQLVDFNTMKKEVFELLDKYQINEVLAYNVTYDYYILKKTNSVINGAWEFFGNDVHFIDIMDMAKAYFKNNRAYRAFCEDATYNDEIKVNMLTPTGRVSLRAEDVFRYIIKDTGFNESHTGLEDVYIETQIYAKLKQYKKKQPNYKKFSH